MVTASTQEITSSRLPKKLSKNSKLYKSVLRAIDNKKGENITILDLREIEKATSDFMVVCQAETSPQIRALAQEIEREVRESCQEHPYHVEGLDQLLWVIVDYVDIVVHIMTPESRDFYNLEELWGDALGAEE